MLDVRLARLGLPLPLEPAIGRALMHRERAAQHEGLVLAWELAIRILAGSLWAVCRHVGMSSTALERVAAKLDRPSLGHWVELARTSASLLRDTNHPAAEAFRMTFDGLDAPVPLEGGLRTLVNRFAELPDAPPRPKRLQEVLDQIPHYRNSAQSTHKSIGTAFREDSVTALLEGLVDFCERVPLVGAHSLVLVGRMERRGKCGSAELARLHGTFPSWSTRELSEAAWKDLVSSRPYLYLDPDIAVPLFPMAAVASSGGEWHVGWYARHVHVPTVAYQGAGGHEFQLALAPDEMELLLRGARTDFSTSPSPESLRLDPYRGLLAYDEEHSAIFFGREEETEAAIAQIEARGALFVIGASGSGKSSWLRAGIVPALRARAALSGKALLPIVVVPGDRPIASLRRAITIVRAGTPEEAAAWARAVDDAIPEKFSNGHERGLAQLLHGLAALGSLPALVVDQLEESVTATIDRDEGRAFQTLLAAAARSAHDTGCVVLASARADMLGPLIEHAGLRRFLHEEAWPIASIPQERLLRVIVEPLHGRHVMVEPGLPETMLADVADEPGSLALLSQVLTTVWGERSRFGGALTKAGYVDAGRVAGALERQAEGALAATCVASPEAATVVDRLFRALAQSDDGEKFTRRRVRLASLVSELGMSEDDVRRIAAPFVERRLVVLDGEHGGETVEVAHERLLDAWPRLKNLLASEREILELRREVESASSAWELSGGRSELWSDGTSRLRRSEELLATGRLDLDERGREFLAHSRYAVRRRRALERTVIGALGLLLILALGAAAWARAEGMRADQRASEAGRLEAAAIRRERELLVQGLIGDLAAFRASDDSLRAAMNDPRPAHEWWFESAQLVLDGQQEDPSRGYTWRPGIEAVEEQLSRLRLGVRPVEPGSGLLSGSTSLGWAFPDSTQQWWHEQLAEVHRGLKQLELSVAVAHRSVRESSAAESWRAAISAISRNEHYSEVQWPRGHSLAPQIGLVPIGPDPDSGLWEFAHLESGDLAARDGQNRLILTPDTGIVFVLLPGGHIPIERVPDHLASIQPEGLSDVQVLPFFISKFELTRAQAGQLQLEWRQSDGDASLLFPARFSSSQMWNIQMWDPLATTLAWLHVPDEVQWEYACRGGTHTAWWTGNQPDSRTPLKHSSSTADMTGLAFIGSSQPNPFGLHDVHGNAPEWCHGSPDLLLNSQGGGHHGIDRLVLRGGDGSINPEATRSSHRTVNSVTLDSVAAGLRPARWVTP